MKCSIKSNLQKFLEKKHFSHETNSYFRKNFKRYLFLYRTQWDALTLTVKKLIFKCLFFQMITTAGSWIPHTAGTCKSLRIVSLHHCIISHQSKPMKYCKIFFQFAPLSLRQASSELESLHSFDIPLPYDTEPDQTSSFYSSLSLSYCNFFTHLMKS